MNYRNFFKKSSGKIFLPEGVDTEQLKMGIKTEKEHTKDVGIAAKIALDHLKEDPQYYTKLNAAGLEEEFGDEPHKEIEKIQKGIDVGRDPHPGKTADKQWIKGRMSQLRNDYPKSNLGPDSNDVDECGCEDVDDNEGLPKLGGALAIPHIGQPIHMSKIISVGAGGIQRPSGQSASGDLSGYTSVGGVAKDSGGIPATSAGDKEPITAGGHKVSNDLVSKSVGGNVVPGEGQKQGGPNTKGTIANTAKLNEGKERIRGLVKEVLKEITFNKKSGKWERITENTVDMKMGPSYKVANRQYRTSADDPARTVQYDPEITEMLDEEEIEKMEVRLSELAVVQRTLTEDELAELNTLSQKLEEENWIQKAVNPSHKGYCTPMTKSTCTPSRKALAQRFKKGIGESNSVEEASYKVASPTQATFQKDDQARTVQTDPHVTEDSDVDEPMVDLDDGGDVGDAGECPECGNVKGNIGMGKTAQCARCGTDYEVQHDTSPESSLHGFNPEMSDTELGKIAKLDSDDLAGVESDDIDEAGGGAVQHRSYRTIDDVPQNVDARWSDEVDEATKPKKESDVAKKIKKGQKTKKTIKADQLKHQPPRMTKSGVHKKEK